MRSEKVSQIISLNEKKNLEKKNLKNCKAKFTFYKPKFLAFPDNQICARRQVNQQFQPKLDQNTFTYHP